MGRKLTFVCLQATNFELRLIFWKDLNDCSLENALIVGGVPSKEQHCNIVKVATCRHDCNINARLQMRGKYNAKHA